MKKALGAALTAVALASGGILQATPAQAASVNPACQFIFLVPHQDDELLTMGAGIREHVRVHGGAAVCVVFMTTGTHSGVQDAMKNPAYNPDGKAYNLTDAQFTAARDKESWNALVWMGVPKGNIYMNGFGSPNTGVPRIFDQNDGSNQAQVDSWMTATMGYFRTPRHYKTMSDKTTDTGDHHAMGTALRKKVGDSRVLSARWYAEPYRAASVTTYNVPVPPADLPLMQKANNSFRVWSPASGYYRVGYRSVTNLFDAHAKSPSSFTHT